MQRQSFHRTKASMKHRILWALGGLWALPYTLLGMLLGASSSCRPQRSHGALNYYVRKGPVRLVCDRLGIAAFTLGDCVLYVVEPTNNLRVHEGRHIAQYRALGPFFLPLYYLLLMIYGYANHPLEKDARDHERRICGSCGPSKLMGPDKPKH